MQGACAYIAGVKNMINWTDVYKFLVVATTLFTAIALGGTYTTQLYGFKTDAAVQDQMALAVNYDWPLITMKFVPSSTDTSDKNTFGNAPKPFNMTGQRTLTFNAHTFMQNVVEHNEDAVTVNHCADEQTENTGLSVFLPQCTPNVNNQGDVSTALPGLVAGTGLQTSTDWVSLTPAKVKAIAAITNITAGQAEHCKKRVHRLSVSWPVAIGVLMGVALLVEFISAAAADNSEKGVEFGQPMARVYKVSMIVVLLGISALLFVYATEEHTATNPTNEWAKNTYREHWGNYTYNGTKGVYKPEDGEFKTHAHREQCYGDVLVQSLFEAYEDIQYLGHYAGDVEWYDPDGVEWKWRKHGKNKDTWQIGNKMKLHRQHKREFKRSLDFHLNRELWLYIAAGFSAAAAVVLIMLSSGKAWDSKFQYTELKL